MDKEIRFTEKKVDESWKDDVQRQKGVPAPEPPTQDEKEKSAVSFAAFLSSLGYQALMHLGEIPHPETRQAHLDLEAARETIDILVMLESKTRGNRNKQEEDILKKLITELQMKFVQRSSAA